MRTVRAKLFLATFVVGALSALAVGLVLNVWLGRLTVQRIEQTLGAETQAGRRDADAQPDDSSLGARRRGRSDRCAHRRARHLHRPGRHGARRLHAKRRGPGARWRTTASGPKSSPPRARAARCTSGATARRPSTTRCTPPSRSRTPWSRTCAWRCRSRASRSSDATSFCSASPGVLASLPIAALLSWALTAPMAGRVSSIAEVARRYATGDLTRPLAGYGEDELGEVARALDGAVQQLGRRVNELAHDRRHLRAILSGMAEGRRGRGRPWPAGDGQRRGARHAEARRLGDGPAVSGVDAAARDLRPAGGGHRRRGAARCRVHARARSVAHLRRACGPGRRTRGRRDPGAARHQRPAPRRSRAPRLRRQRLARAAHAAHRDPRLRRSADGRTGVVRSEPPVPRDHRASHRPHGAAREGPAPPGAPRRRAGDAGSGGVRSLRVAAGRASTSWRDRSAAAGRRSASRWRRTCARWCPIPQSCTTSSATCSRTRSTTHRKARRCASRRIATAATRSCA